MEWKNGNENPTNDGEYYIIIEAQHDIGDLQKGDIEVASDYFHPDWGEWETIDKNNPTWKVLYWAEMTRPAVPSEIVDRVKVFFGSRVDF